jgi:hypothetical protein
VVLRRVVDRLQGFVPSKLVHTLTLPKNAFGGGMCGEQVDEYAYPHGTMAVGIGRDAYGRNLVGIVYGPNSAFDTGTPFSANDLFSSLVSDVPTCVSPTS